MNKTIEVTPLMAQINQFSVERNWEQFHSAKNLSMALSVEVAELLEIFQWKTESQSNDKNDSIQKNKVQDELADIFIYLLKIADKFEIDLEKASYEKIIKNNLKYPIEKSFGNSKKYTEL